MTTLTITRGLPGSGKSTWAKTQPGWRVNRDDLRAMVQTRWLHGDPDLEDLLTEAQHAMIRTLLEWGVDVVVDDTNLRPSVVEDLRDLAGEMGAEFQVRDMTDVPLETCIARDAARPAAQRVGADVIRGMWRRYLAPQGCPSCGPAGCAGHTKPMSGVDGEAVDRG